MNNKITNFIFQYYEEIRSGRIRAGKWIIAVYEWLVQGIKNGTWEFDYKKANKAIKFIENFCHHSEGRSDLLKLELWQKAIVSAIFGILDKKTGYRQFREVFLLVARKNGKTLFASAIMAYMAYMDKEYGAKLYCLAPKLDQAELAYDAFYQIVQGDEELNEISKKRRSDIYIKDLNTSIKKIAFNSKKSDGFNPHFVLNDEMEAWEGDRGLKQYEVMKSALGARKQPLILSTSTAGYISDGIFDELMKRATSLLKGNSREQRLLPFLYMIDDIEKWNTREELEKSNPNLGVSVFWDFYEEEIKIAMSSLPKKAEFMTKYCNIKQNSSVAWLEYLVVERTECQKYTLEDFRGCYCVGGVDLSKTTDLTAATVIIERDGKNYVFTQFFMCAERYKVAIDEDGVPYNIFREKGILQISGQNKINYKDVVKWFVDMVKTYKIKPLKIGYDKWCADPFVDEMKDFGFHMDDVKQGPNLTPVLNEFEGDIKDGKYYTGDNSLLRAHLLNMAVKIDDERNTKTPTKIEKRMRIDGGMSLMDAATVKQKWYKEIGRQLKNAA